MKNSPLMNAFPIVAASYGRKFGVKVKIAGDQAYTDGESIVIPNLNPLTPELKNALWGFLTHEAAHVRLTSFSVRCVNPLKQALLNVLEDGRIEDAFMQAYPGTRDTLAATASHVFSGEQNEPDSEAGAICQMVLGWVRYHFLRQDAAETVFKLGERAFKALYSAGAYVQAMALLPHLANCASTQDCKELVEKLVCKIEEEEQKEQQGAEASGNDQDDPSNDQSDQSDGNSRDNQDAPSNDQSGQSNGQSGGSQDDGSCQGSGSAMARALDTDEEELPDDYLDSFRQEMKQQDDRSGSVPYSLDVCPDLASANDIDSDRVAAARHASNKIRKQLMGLLQSKKRVHATPKRIGRKLNTKSLARLQTGDTRVFLRHGEKQSINTAVHLLTDLSGSMFGNEEVVARDSALALAYALEQIPGVSLGVSYLGPSIVRSVLPQGGKLAPNLGRFNQCADGGTPAAQAIWSGCYQLLHDPAPKKVVVLVTDGAPDSPEAVYHVINLAQRSDIQFIGIGVGSNAVERFIDNSIVINSVNDLTGTLFNEIKLSLLAA